MATQLQAQPDRHLPKQLVYKHDSACRQCLHAADDILSFFPQSESFQNADDRQHQNEQGHITVGDKSLANRRQNVHWRHSCHQAGGKAGHQNDQEGIKTKY